MFKTKPRQPPKRIHQPSVEPHDERRISIPAADAEQKHHASDRPSRIVSVELLMRIQRAFPPWDKHDLNSRSGGIHTDLSTLFNVPPRSITHFRWGQSAAPEGHPHYGSIWLTIDYADITFSGAKTLVVSPAGKVLQTVVD